MRQQDADTTTPRQPSVAEQRARIKAEEQQRQQEIADQQAAAETRRKADTKRKVLIGSGVTVGVVGLVAAWYAVTPKDVEATCTDNTGTVVDDKYCDEGYASQQPGYSSGGGFIFIPGGIGGGSYRYNYGGTGTVGGKVSGGTFDAPSKNTSVNTKSGKSVQRGGFGISSSGKSGGS